MVSDHQIRDWRAVSAAGLQGKGWHKEGFLFYKRRYDLESTKLNWIKLS